METSVLIQVPYELESAYSPLEERTDIDYTVMSVDNFNVGDFLIGLYITISSNSIITGVVSGGVDCQNAMSFMNGLSHLGREKR